MIYQTQFLDYQNQNNCHIQINNNMSSVKSSTEQLKENINPNFVKTRQSPNIQKFDKRSYRLPSHPSNPNNPSNPSRSEQLSFLRTIGQNKNSASQGSIKTLIQGFCTTGHETTTFSDNFVNMVHNHIGRSCLSEIELIDWCKKQHIYNKEDLLCDGRQTNSRIVVDSFWKCKNILVSDLGQFMVQQLCKSIINGDELTNQYSNIIEKLIPYYHFQNQSIITSQQISLAYKNYRQEKQFQREELFKLQASFKRIRENNINQKLKSDHFKLKLATQLNTQKQRVFYRNLCQIMDRVLSVEECAVVFRYIYAFQSGMMMALLDGSKSISLTFFKTCLFGEGQINSNLHNYQPKSELLSLQHAQLRIQKVQKQNTEIYQLAEKRKQKIQNLKQQINQLQIQKQQALASQRQEYELKIQGERNKFLNIIKNLTAKMQNQTKIKQWYNKELEAMIQSVNKETVIRKFMPLRFL